MARQKEYQSRKTNSNAEQQINTKGGQKSNSNKGAHSKPKNNNQYGFGRNVGNGIVDVSIITSIYRSIHFKTIKSNVLVIGNSGTGKTETIKQIAKILQLPYTIEDATKYTQEGYYGADVNDMIYNLIENAGNDIKKARNGIIVIDEIDKKSGHEEHDVAGVEVLKSLLKIIEGTVVKIPDMTDPFGETMFNFDTENIIIIFMGAFSGIDKIREKRLGTNQLGFGSSNSTKNEKSRIIKKDLVEYGMPEEFVGRIDTIVEMNNLTKQDLVSILKRSKLSIFKRYQEELRKKGVVLIYNNNLFEAIADESLAIDTGARELSNTVNYIFENIIYDILSNPGKYKKCQLYPEIVHDNTKYKLL